MECIYFTERIRTHSLIQQRQHKRHCTLNQTGRFSKNGGRHTHFETVRCRPLKRSAFCQNNKSNTIKRKKHDIPLPPPPPLHCHSVTDKSKVTLIEISAFCIFPHFQTTHLSLHSLHSFSFHSATTILLITCPFPSRTLFHIAPWPYPSGHGGPYRMRTDPATPPN